jgi:uncharacterized protein
MDDPKRLYECLLDYCSATELIERIGIGPVWTVCQSRNRDILCSGQAMSPVAPTRTLQWSGTLAGKTLREVGSWLLEWEPYQAAVGMAAINCSINKPGSLPPGDILESKVSGANLTVFDYFLPRLTGKKVVVIGHYPGIERFTEQYGWQVLERMPVGGDYPDPAAEFLLPDADWVFLSASTIVNKTFPRLAELCADATTVLMGPTVPWLAQLHTFGIDYLAGVEVVDAEKLYQTAMEGGGVRIFENSVRYRVVELEEQRCIDWLKQDIALAFAGKEHLSQAMEHWYEQGKTRRFPHYSELDDINRRLSQLDSAYKLLWDRQPGL